MSASDMNGNTDDTQDDSLAGIVDDFVGEYRQGDPRDVENIAEENPEFSDDLKDLLPVVAMMEQWKQEKTVDAGTAVTLGGVMPESLGDFQLMRRIGSGGMGMVFEAHQKTLDRKVAIKILPPAARISSNARDRFYREARLSASLHHPNIVTVYGVGHAEGLHYIVMQLVSALSISSVGDPMKPRRVATLGLQAAKALAFAHSKNILHRDVKPANMLVDENDHLWLADFGLARALEDENDTRTGELAGTLMYLPPERVSGKCDARSDVYSLGLSLYQLLIGRRPIEGNSTAELLSKITAGQYVRDRKVEADAPKDLVVTLRKACALDPEDRYESAADFADDLSAFLEGRPVKARRMNRVQLAAKWARRNPVLASLATAVATLLVCVMVVSVVGYAQQRRERQRVETTLDITLNALERVFTRLAPTRLSASSASMGQPVSAPVSPQTAELLEELLTTYNELTHSAIDNARVRAAVARAHRRIGDIRLLLQEPGDALNAYTSALSAANNATADDPQLWQQFRAETLGKVADAHETLGQQEESANFRSQAIEEFKRVTDSRFEEAKKLELARTLLSGLVLAHQERPPSGPQGRGPNDTETRRSDSQKATRKGQQRSERRNQTAQQTVDLLETIAQGEQASPDARLLLGVGLRELASRGLDRKIEPQHIGRSIEILEQLHAEFPARPDIMVELVQSYARVSPPHLNETEREFAEARSRLEKAIRLSDELADSHVDVPQYQFVSVLSKRRYSDFLMQQIREEYGRVEAVSLEEQYRWLSQAERTLVDLNAAFPEFDQYTQHLLSIRVRLAEVTFRLRRNFEADTLLALTEKKLAELKGEDSEEFKSEIRNTIRRLDQLYRGPEGR